MINGLDKFREYFKMYNTDYVIIGGLATVLALKDYGYLTRATKDIDLVVISKDNEAFLKHLVNFIKEGDYTTKERTDKPNRNNLFRFEDPKNKDFPVKIELFASYSENSEITTGTRIIPIHTPEYYDSISAILLEEDYFNLIKTHAELNDGLRLAPPELLILLKLHAHLNLMDGQTESYDNKHLKDVIRLLPYLDEDLPVHIKDKPAEDYLKFKPILEKISEQSVRAIVKDMQEAEKPTKSDLLYLYDKCYIIERSE